MAIMNILQGRHFELRVPTCLQDPADVQVFSRQGFYTRWIWESENHSTIHCVEEGAIHNSLLVAV